jgi:hypothetical protein
MCHFYWLGIKNDYRTLIDLVDVDAVEISIDIDDEKGNE